MAIVSDALPIQFWPISSQTFNEEQIAFMQKRAFYQEFLDSDSIKLQISGETDGSVTYGLRITDVNGNQLALVAFTRSVTGSTYRFDLEFTLQSLSIDPQCLRLFISSTSGTLTDIWKSDSIIFSAAIPLNAGYGTKLIYYNSTKNFAGIVYPNNSHYFLIRIPSRFYRPRNVRQQNSLQLSNSSIVTTSISMTQQKLFETVLLPQYMLDKLELILQHCVAGSVIIDGIEWQADESFDRKDIDIRSPFDSCSTWLSKGVVRNII